MALPISTNENVRIILKFSSRQMHVGVGVHACFVHEAAKFRKIRRLVKMGGFTCIASGCKRNSNSHKWLKFFSLPKDESSRKIWVELLGCCGETLPSYARVCSIHFHPDYHTWTCQKLGEETKGCQCRPNKYPSLNLPANAVNTDTLNSLQLHLSKKRKSIEQEQQNLAVSMKKNSSSAIQHPINIDDAVSADFDCHLQEDNLRQVKENEGNSELQLSKPVNLHGEKNSCTAAQLPRNSNACPRSVPESPQKARAKKIVELVLVQHERVPPLIMTKESAQTSGLDYMQLSKTDLVQKLLESNKDLEMLKQQHILDMQRAVAKERELAETENRVRVQEEKIRYLGSTNEHLQATTTSLREQLKSAWKEGKQVGVQVATNFLEGVFSSAQISALITRKRVSWSPDDLSSAVALHACSPKAYKFIRATMKIPLPSKATLHRWAAKAKITPGLQNLVLTILQKLGNTMSEKERLVTLSFDEMMLSKRIQYDVGRDAVVGPHSHAQVVFIRSLVGDWKQPVYFNFDVEMTKELFLEICTALFGVGFTVVASVCDLGPTNQTFLRNMNVFDTEECSHPHPCDPTSPIFFLADCPHMLKLLRNHILDQGLIIPGGQFKSQILKTTIDMINRRQLRAADKLHEGLLELNCKARMRVRPAAQLLSASMSTSITYLVKQGILRDKDALLVAEFVQCTNDWFDVTNSRSSVKPSEGDLKQQFGNQLVKQQEALKKMTNFVSKMRVKGRQALLPFQRGILMSNNSIIKLHEFLSTRYGITHFSTSKLNQDCVENFFSWIRASSITYTSPTALDFIFRFRKFLMSKTSTHFSENTNCKNDNVSNICTEALYQHIENEETVLTGTAFSEIANNTPGSVDSEEEDLERQLSEGELDDEDDGGGEEDGEEVALHGLDAEFVQEDSGPEEIIFGESSGSSLHHRSKEIQALVDSLVQKNGVTAMASLIIRKCDIQHEKPTSVQHHLEESMLNEEDKQALKGKEWMINCVFLMEQEFNKYHGPAISDFKRCEGVNKTLCELIVQNVKCDISVAIFFVKTRLSMRIRDHNMPIRNASLNCSNKSYSKYYS